MRRLNPLKAGQWFRPEETALVVELQASKKKLSLSIKEMKIREQKKEISKYIHEDDNGDSTFTLADMLKDREG